MTQSLLALTPQGLAAVPAPTLQNLAASGGSALIGFIASGVGAKARTVQDKLREVPSVVDYGADPTGTTNSTAAFRAALAANYAVKVPKGIFLVSASILAIASEKRLYGVGASVNGSVIRVVDMTGDVLSVSSPGPVVVEELYFDTAGGAQRTSGSFIKVTGSRATIRDCQFWNGHDGVTVNGSDNITLSRLKLFSMGGYVIDVQGGFNHIIDEVHCDASAGSQPAAGLHVSAVGDLTVRGCQFLHAGTALFVDVADGASINSLNLSQSYFDSSNTAATLRSTGTGQVSRADFNQCWFGNSSVEGVSISSTGTGTVDGITFNNCRFVINAGDGLSLGANAKNITVIGGQISQNSTGVYVESTAELFMVMGRVGAAEGLTGNTLGFNIINGATGRAIGTRIKQNTTQVTNGSPSFHFVETSDYISTNYGQTSVTTDAFGEALVPHGLSGTPVYLNVQYAEYSPNDIRVSSFDATNIKIRIRNSTTDAPVTGALETIMWEAKL